MARGGWLTNRANAGVLTHESIVGTVSPPRAPTHVRLNVDNSKLKLLSFPFFHPSLRQLSVRVVLLKHSTLQARLCGLCASCKSLIHTFASRSGFSQFFFVQDLADQHIRSLIIYAGQKYELGER